MKDARFLSILLATATLACAALVAEYLYKLDQPSPRAAHQQSFQAPPAQAASIEARDLPAPMVQQPAPGVGIEVEQHGLMRKCVAADGKVSYTDKACPTGEQARLIAKDAGSAGLHPQRSYQQQLAEEAARRPVAAPERQAPVAGRIASSPEAPDRTCAELDREIAALDAVLRQPHDPKSGDDLTAQRKQAADRRYALHCGR